MRRQPVSTMLSRMAARELGLRRGRADPPTFDQPAVMALVLGGLFVAGGMIGALSLILPHPSEYNETALWSNVGIAFAAGFLLLLIRNRIPVWAVQLAVLGGTLVITRAVYYGDDPSGHYTFWYLWVGVYAIFFFRLRWGALQLAAVGIAYGWALAELGDSTPVARWIVTLGSIGVAGFLVDTLAGRLRSETASAARRAANLEAVGEVARQLATQSDPRAVGFAICSAALEATHGDAAVLWRPAPAGTELVATEAAGVQFDEARLPYVTAASGAIRSFTTAAARFGSMEGGDHTQELPGFTAGSALWQPVLKDEVAVGVLAVYWRDAHEAVGTEARRAVRLLGLEAAIAIERGELLGRLEVAARTDDLTGLLNRRAWDAELSRELARADRSGHPLCVAILDLDRFKQYNDAHGHQAGDRFLKTMAGSWSEELRGSDILARYGGEEFSLAMPATDLEGAELMLDRLRQALPQGQTCSAGVCLWDGEESAEKLTARADTALYAAKGAGRDTVVSADQETGRAGGGARS
jgi:diguanylate cyclase (GGDEF)-like protein